MHATYKIDILTEHWPSLSFHASQRLRYASTSPSAIDPNCC